ncbi:unnamed protein product [Urochloa decumbens]|uniref:Uncharacterized protein n=1 Tax=Urochloa decumbens TaxID=240449 RepID=A0ABC8ZK79_9POAL
MAPSFPGSSSKRPLDMVLYDPAAAAKRARQEEAASTSSSSSASSATTAAALFVRAASAPPPFGDFEPISAVPISAVPSQLLPPPPPLLAGREEPPCLRSHFLAALGLRADLPVHFIDDKHLTGTDLDPHQNRLRLPMDGAVHRLRPLLTPAELHAANLLLLPDPKPRAQPPKKPQGGGAVAEDEKAGKKPKAKGKVHGGLRVNLVSLAAGAKELLLSRWDSTHATVVKGEGYLDFVVRRCGFREGDAVEIWAFVQRRVRLFGADVCGGSLLHVLLVKKGQGCCYCHDLPPAPAPAVHPSIGRELVVA